MTLPLPCTWFCKRLYKLNIPREIGKNGGGCSSKVMHSDRRQDIITMTDSKTLQ